MEIGLEELGLMEGSRAVNTLMQKETITEEGEIKLDREGPKVYRGFVARLNYLAKFRLVIARLAKEMSRGMAKPTKASWIRMKRIHRYLKRASGYVLDSRHESRQERITAGTD